MASLLRLLVAVVAVCCQTAVVIDASRVHLDPTDNAYRGLVVAISPKIKPVLGRQIIPNLEAVLRNASLELFKNRGIYIGEVHVIIPRSWGNKGQWARQPLPKIEAPTWQTHRDADILIERGEESVFGENPFVVQHGGCGVQGRHMVIPDTFLRNYVSEQHYEKYGKPHHVFMREWAVYRYGVFKEHGFPRDPVYPLYRAKPGSLDGSDIELNVCTERPVWPHFRNGNGVACNATINLMNGLPMDQDCIPVYSIHDKVESSIMSGIPSATHFCGGHHHHDRTLPTKQNVMCNERSATEIIEQHEDFYRRARNGLQGRTRFVFVQEKAQVMTVLIQISEATLQHQRRYYILRALEQFMTYDVPKDMQISIVTYGDVEAEIGLRRAPASEDNVKKAVATLLLNADIDPGQNSSLAEGLKLALEALNDTSELMERIPPSSFTQRVVVIGDGHLDKNLEDIVRHNYEYQDIRVDSIIFPSPSNDLKKINTLDKFVARTGGRTVAISDVSIDDSVTVTALQVLYDAFYSFAYGGLSGQEEMNYADIEQREFHGKEQHDINFDFYVDPSLNRDLRVRLIGHDYGLDKAWTVSSRDLKLSAPDENDRKVYTTKDYKFLFTDGRFWYYEFRIPDPAPGHWKLEAKARKDTKQPIIVTAAAKPSKEEEPILLDAWISQPTFNVSLRNEGLIVYAKLSKGSRPVVDAKVVAKITPVSDQTETQLCVELKDNGAGDPDITKDDGIYSRYIEGIKNIGRHTLIVEAKSDGNAALLRSATVPDDTVPHTPCCGSAVVRTASNATKPFSRRVHYGSFFVTKVSREQRDGEIRAPWAAPGRIADLRVVYLQSNPSGVSLAWTATGNVKDHGKASSYVIKKFDNRDDAVAQFDERGQDISHWEMDGNPPIPKEAGAMEQVFIKTLNQVPVYFAIKVNNSYGTLSAVSNIVVVSVMPPATTTSSSSSSSTLWNLGQRTTQGGGNGGGNGGGGDYSNEEGSTDQREARIQPGQIALFIAIPLVVLVLGTCVLIVIVARRKRDPMEKKPSPDTNKNGELDTPKSGTLSKDGSTRQESPVLQSPKEGMTPMGVEIVHQTQQSGLSPINSWPAEVLLDHYGKVQEAKQRNELPPVLSLNPHSHDESLHSSNPSLYSTMDPFRRNTGQPVVYSPYYGNPPIVTPMGVHVSRNITQV